MDQQPVDRRLAADAVGELRRPLARVAGIDGFAEPLLRRPRQLEPLRHRSRPRRIARKQRRQPPHPLRREPGVRFAGDQVPQPRRALRADLRQNRQEDCVFDHQRDRRARVGHRQQLQQLVGDPLAGQRHQVARTGRAGGKRIRVGTIAAEARLEAEEAQDAEMILGNPLEGIADEAHPPRRQIGDAAEIVGHRARDRVRGERVDGEVAACRILAPVVGIGDGGVPPVGRDVAAQRRHLHRAPVEDNPDGAVRQPRRRGPDRQADAARALRDRFRHQPGGEIEVERRCPAQRVAHPSADEAGCALRCIERVEQPRHRVRIDAGGRKRHGAEIAHPALSVRRGGGRG